MGLLTPAAGMERSFDSIVLLGGNSEVFREYLKTDDPCFGKSYAKTSDVCRSCICPVLFDGRVMLLHEVCAAWQAPGVIAALKRLSSAEVLDRIKRGKTAKDIFTEILNGTDPVANGKAARDILSGRWWYLRFEKREQLPDLPALKDLV